MSQRAWVSLGSNLGDRAAQLEAAALALDDLAGIRVLARSSVYETEPWGDQDQPAFLNAVLLLETSLEPHQLLDALQAVESRLGRVRGERRWGPRVIDLDLLLMGEARIADGRLVLPHPRLSERAFVLAPLAEVSPELTVPGHGPVRKMLDAVGEAGAETVSVPGWPGRCI